MGWPDTPTALAELRKLLNDNATDKLRALKQVIGKIDGNNVTFKTLEFRRITDFTQAEWPFGVFMNDTSDPLLVDQDDLTEGFFMLDSAPPDGSILTATYYVQFFTDDDLNTFMINASRWIQSSDTFLNVAPGLQPVALKYAAGEAYEKLSEKFQENMSAVFRTEDAPDEKNVATIASYFQKAQKFKDMAVTERKEYYTRQGTSDQPLWGNNLGRVRDVPPRR
jgi:hypothetical protein